MSKKLFVGNLSYDADEDAILAHFRDQGFEATGAHVPKDRENGDRPRGFAFVEFSSEEEAANARAQCDGQPIMGRPVRIDTANDRPPRGRGGPRRPRY